jgi:hypothetical protein
MATQTEVLERVGKLIKLAHSDNEEEARTAAMQATRLMQEHKLVVVPIDELERVQKVIGESQALAKRIADESNNKLLMGLALGFFGAKNL